MMRDSRRRALALVILFAFAAMSCSRSSDPSGNAAGDNTSSTLPDPGVSEELAQERASVVRNLRYEVHFTVPAERTAPVRGRSTVLTTLLAPHRLVFDFAQPTDRLTKVVANGRALTPDIFNGHIIVPEEATVGGENRIDFEFAAGDESLNRNDEFLYTLFVPARAQFAFPCFDQPDLKGRYALSLDVPEGWQAVANGREEEREGGRIRFAETASLPTYLFAFAAGKFSLETASRDGRPWLRIFHRETDPAKVARNKDAIVDLHARALAWLAEYTALPYPFGKFDIVLIPSFQFTGMEHAGAIFYNQASLLLDESATQNQLLGRAAVIAHETAHMWFGNLVTMKWFNDVWMKEVFANFMAAKIVNPSFPELNHELRFLLDHYPSAYQVDRTAGTNPIRQTLANLNEAGQMYGPIIYEKAPIVMRQLELITGETAFRDGLREYLKRFAFGNATWLDLVPILDAQTPRDIAAWSRAWVEERGRPEFEVQVRAGADDRLAGITLTARDPFDRGLVWPQHLRVTLGYPGRMQDVEVDVSGRETAVTVPPGAGRPSFVLPNGGGLGYGLFVLDDTSRAYLLERMASINDPLTRGSAWVTLWDNLLESRIAPAAFMDAALRALPAETDEQNTQRVLAYVERAFWAWLPREERAATGASLEAAVRQGLARAKTQSQKAAWFNAFRDTATTPDGLAWLERVWRRQERVPGLTLAEADEITLALELAVREVSGWQAILEMQRDRTQNPDRKARFAFVMPALSADPAIREQAFERFRIVDNRRREVWVEESLRYLNHPLREGHAQRFVQPALEMLEEIQRTGDIFFPTGWMESILWGHRSPEVAATVRAFLAARPEYPQRLEWTILVNADELFRVADARESQGGQPAPRPAESSTQ